MKWNFREKDGVKRRRKECFCGAESCGSRKPYLLLERSCDGRKKPNGEDMCTKNAVRIFLK